MSLQVACCIVVILANIFTYGALEARALLVVHGRAAMFSWLALERHRRHHRGRRYGVTESPTLSPHVRTPLQHNPSNANTSPVG